MIQAHNLSLPKVSAILQRRWKKPLSKFIEGFIVNNEFLKGRGKRSHLRCPLTLCSLELVNLLSVQIMVLFKNRKGFNLHFCVCKFNPARPIMLPMVSVVPPVSPHQFVQHTDWTAEELR